MDKINVLLVDDDPDFLELTSHSLRKASLGVETACDGKDALEKLKKCRPELIIADVQMPGMNGYELCRQIRMSGYDDIPFFFCSVSNTLPERIMGLRMGADDYLIKPVDAEELLLKVMTHLEKHRKMHAFKESFKELAPSKILPHLMQGNLSEMKVFEVLQMLDMRGRGEVCAHFEGPSSQKGDIYLVERNIVHAELGGISGQRAFYRILAWPEGRFRIEPMKYSGEPTISGRLDHWLMDGLAQLDEYRLLHDSLIEKGEYLWIQYGKKVFDNRFIEDTSKILKLIVRYHHIDKILDNTPLTDLETMRVISELMQLGIVTASKKFGVPGKAGTENGDPSNPEEESR